MLYRLGKGHLRVKRKEHIVGLKLDDKYHNLISMVIHCTAFNDRYYVYLVFNAKK